RKPSKELSDEAGASIVDLAHGAFVTPLGADGTGRRQEAVRATSVNVEYGSTDTPNKASQRKHVMRAYTTRAEPHMQLRGPLTRLARKHLNKDGATKEVKEDDALPRPGMRLRARLGPTPKTQTQGSLHLKLVVLTVPQ
ncbi:hypothetical protein FOZ62_009931, partial [Perkinsus olseni]